MAAGDQAALGELYDATSSLIYGLALRMLSHAQDAEEVVSDVYMKAWRHAANYSRERGSVAAWLVMMTRSIAIDRIRQRRPQQRGAPTLEEIAEPASRGPSEQALAELPAEQRSLLEMAFFSGLTHAELAEQTGIPLGTVKTRIRLGLQRLRGALGIHLAGGME
jgi:RNA polymerase sigma-70 factor (ECF subfamily)